MLWVERWVVRPPPPKWLDGRTTRRVSARSGAEFRSWLQAPVQALASAVAAGNCRPWATWLAPRA